MVLDDVDFGYTEDKIVLLHNITLYAEAGPEDRLCGSHQRRQDDDHKH